MGQCRKLYFVIVPYYIAKCEYTNRLDKKKLYCAMEIRASAILYRDVKKSEKCFLRAKVVV